MTGFRFSLLWFSTAFVGLARPSLHALLTGAALLVWLVGVGMLAANQHRYTRLTRLQSLPDASVSLPSLSILVPACNEAHTVERGMRSLLALNYPHLEIIAVNDRSTDATGAILDRLAREDTRLHVRHISELPPGWLGKNHALHVASEAATGKWLLFTDADVVFAPDTLLRAIAYAERKAIDHLVVAPVCETHGFWEKLFVSYFGLMFSFRVRPWEVSNPRKSAFAGLGAFNLVKTAGYRSFGGHRALPLEVADDTKLGKVIKKAGLRTEIVEGGDLLSVRWVVGFRGILDCLDKNAFAGFDFSLPLLLGSVTVLALTACYPVAALLLPGTLTRGMGLAAFALMVGGAAMSRRVSQASAAYGLAYPLAALLLIFLIFRSVFHAYQRGGILWRGTLYPLDELRRGVV